MLKAKASLPCLCRLKKAVQGGAKMAEEQEGETTFSPTNSSKERLDADQTARNNF